MTESGKTESAKKESWKVIFRIQYTPRLGGRPFFFKILSFSLSCLKPKVDFYCFAMCKLGFYLQNQTNCLHPLFKALRRHLLYFFEK